MLVRFPQPLVIAEYFNYDRFGEIVLALPLAGETRPFTGTAIDEPGAPANARTAANSLRRITLDDALSAQNPATLRHPNGAPFSLDQPLPRRRHRAEHGRRARLRLQPLPHLHRPDRPTTPPSNPRPAAPEPVGGTVCVCGDEHAQLLRHARLPDRRSAGQQVRPGSKRRMPRLRIATSPSNSPASATSSSPRWPVWMPTSSA